MEALDIQTPPPTTGAAAAPTDPEKHIPWPMKRSSLPLRNLPIGRFMASYLPETKFRLPGLGSRMFSLNPGPFNMKEHVLITIFANAGSAFGNGSAYAVNIVTIIKAFYHRKISFIAGWLLITTTQVLGYGWAGLLRKYVVEPAHMWWPSTLVQVSLFRALHEREKQQSMSRAKFFLIALICSFSWYLVPGYLFTTLTSISWVCWVFSKSVTAQQIGSGMRGLGLGAVTLDWSAVSSFLSSPLISPFFSIVNIFAGYILIVFIAIPTAYWGFDLYNASRFPIFSSHLFTAVGKKYDISAIVNDKFELDQAKYTEQGRIHLSMFSLSRMALDLPQSQPLSPMCYSSMAGKFMSGIMLLIGMPWWGLLFAGAMAFVFTLPISIITATTNQTPGLNIITEYAMGLIYPGRPIANVCFKTYGYMSMAQAVSFLSDFKLGHYMKIPPRSMFLVQFIGTILAATVNLAVAVWLLDSIKNICQDDLLPADSPWTCPGDRVFFDASVIWGLVGPKRMFGTLGNYAAMNWFFLGGAIGPVIVWLLHKSFPKQSWIPLINLPVLLGATGMMPPATPLNYNAWIIVGTIFNFYIFRYRKQWWQRYNYVLSAALDAGVAFMGVLLYFSLGLENKSLTWWGTDGEHCPLATCPTAKGIVADGCPMN
ncbi:hypothetical protein SLA2020_348280 [Shorea laevis]